MSCALDPSDEHGKPFDHPSRTAVPINITKPIVCRTKTLHT